MTTGRQRWAPPADVATPSGTIAGGAVLGAAVGAIETETGRPALWATAQFAAPLAWSDEVDLQVAVVASGRATSQATCGVAIAGHRVATVVAATGERSTPPPDAALDAPRVRRPADCPPCPYLVLVADGATGGMAESMELRLARGGRTVLTGRPQRPGRGRVAVWVRPERRGRRMFGVGPLALVGDLAPIALTDRLGRLAGGTSLDNTLRLGPIATGEWLLLDARVVQVARGVAHLRAEVWTEEGTLVATAEQSCIVRTVRS